MHWQRSFEERLTQRGDRPLRKGIGISTRRPSFSLQHSFLLRPTRLRASTTNLSRLLVIGATRLVKRNFFSQNVAQHDVTLVISCLQCLLSCVSGFIKASSLSISSGQNA